MYALIPNKDTLFALATVQRKLATAFSEHFAPHLVACPTYPLWALTPSPLPPVISSCRILAPRLLHEAGVIAFPVELVSPCGTSSPSAHASPADTIEPPLSVAVEGSQLCGPVAPAIREESSVQCERQEGCTTGETCPPSKEAGVPPCDRAESPLVGGLACASKKDSGSQLDRVALPLLWGEQYPNIVASGEGSVWQLSIVAARVLCQSTGWGFAHGLCLDWQVSGCELFPRSERVFRVGKVELEGTGWRLVRDRWCKVN